MENGLDRDRDKELKGCESQWVRELKWKVDEIEIETYN